MAEPPLPEPPDPEPPELLPSDFGRAESALAESQQPRSPLVIVGVSGSLGSVAALHAGFAEARRTGALLIALMAWTPRGGEISYRRGPSLYLLEMEHAAARERLRDVFDAAFAGQRSGVAAEAHLVRADAGPALVAAASHPSDRLVVGSGSRGRFRALRGSVARYCLTHAECPVLAVPPPPLLREWRGLRWREPDVSALAR